MKFVHLLLFAVLTWLCLLPLKGIKADSLHKSQARKITNISEKSDIVVDYKALEDYTPPPMFEDSIEVSPLNEAISFPIEEKTYTNSVNPSKSNLPLKNNNLRDNDHNDDNHNKGIDIDYSNIDITKELEKGVRAGNSDNILDKNKISKFNKTKKAKVKPALFQDNKTPPKPSKRPQKFYASKSFIEEAKLLHKQSVDTHHTSHIKPAVNPIKETPAKPKPIVKDNIINITEDPLSKSLDQPNAHEVLMALENELQNQIDISKYIKPQISEEIKNAESLVSLKFEEGQNLLSEKMLLILENKIIQALKEDNQKQIQIHAFASSYHEAQSSDRRLSLTRALSVRKYLIEQNIDPKRIDIRALGQETKAKPKDRVDLILLKSRQL